MKLTFTLEDLEVMDEGLERTPWAGKRGKHLLESYGEDVSDVASEIRRRLRTVLMQAKGAAWGSPLPSAGFKSLREIEIVRMLIAHIAEDIRHDFRRSRWPENRLSAFLDGKLPRVESLGKRLDEAAEDIKRRIVVEVDLPEK